MRAVGVVLLTLVGETGRRPGVMIASVASMAVGVAVFVAIHLSGSAARSSFVSAVEGISGRATHEVVAEGGLREERFASLATLPGVEVAQPVIEARVSVREVVRSGEIVVSEPPSLRLLGIAPLFAGPFVAASPEPVEVGDLERFLLDPSALVVSARWADETGTTVGDRVVIAAAGRRHELRVIAAPKLSTLGEASRDVALVDLAVAQEILGRVGTVDRVELVLGGPEAPVVAGLEGGERLDRPARRGERVASMIDAFRLNILALGGLALVVGSLLVFNSAQFAVIRREDLLGKLRCLGAGRRTVMGAVLLEVAIHGLVGGVLGVLLGKGLARGLVGPVAETVTNLYGFVVIESTPLEAWFVAACVAGAVLLAVAAGAFPAFDASRTPPRMVGIRSRQEDLLRSQLPRLVAVGSLWALVAAVAIVVPSDSWWFGLLSAFAAIWAGACFVPPLMAFGLPRIRRFGERTGSLRTALAAGAISRSLTRTGGAAAALGVALAMSVGVIVMVSSFEREVEAWIDSAITADVFVADSSQRLSREAARVPEAALAAIRDTPGVATVETLRLVEVPLGGTTVPVGGVEWASQESRERIDLLAGDPATAPDRALAGDVLISEPLSTRLGLGVGDRLVLRGRGGVREPEIVGVFRDYTYDRGFVLTGKEPFVELFGDPGVRNAAVRVVPGVRPEEVAGRLRRELGGEYALEIRSNAELRREVLRVFDRTFLVTYLLEGIATGLALAGVAATLVGLFLERGREIATLRAIGMSRRGVEGLFAVEALLLVGWPVAMSLPLGAVLAWILTGVINVRAFGWTIPFSWPWGTVLATCAAAAVAALLAAATPRPLVRKQSLAMALREE